MSFCHHCFLTFPFSSCQFSIPFAYLGFSACIFDEVAANQCFFIGGARALHFFVLFISLPFVYVRLANKWIDNPTYARTHKPTSYGSKSFMHIWSLLFWFSVCQIWLIQKPGHPLSALVVCANPFIYSFIYLFLSTFCSHKHNQIPSSGPATA